MWAAWLGTCCGGDGVEVSLGEGSYIWLMGRSSCWSVWRQLVYMQRSAGFVERYGDSLGGSCVIQYGLLGVRPIVYRWYWFCEIYGWVCWMFMEMGVVFSTFLDGIVIYIEWRERDQSRDLNKRLRNRAYPLLGLLFLNLGVEILHWQPSFLLDAASTNTLSALCFIFRN